MAIDVLNIIAGALAVVAITLFLLRFGAWVVSEVRRGDRETRR